MRTEMGRYQYRNHSRDLTDLLAPVWQSVTANAPSAFLFAAFVGIWVAVFALMMR